MFSQANSQTKENRLLIQIQKALQRKVIPLFSGTKMFYASKEVKENALPSEGKSCGKTCFSSPCGETSSAAKSEEKRMFSQANSQTKENRLLIQIQKALQRKVIPLFSGTKMFYASKEVKENALASEGKSCRPETKTTINRCVPSPLIVKQVAEITFAQ